MLGFMLLQCQAAVSGSVTMCVHCKSPNLGPVTGSPVHQAPSHCMDTVAAIPTHFDADKTPLRRSNASRTLYTTVYSAYA